MRKKLLIAFIAALLTLPTAAFAAESVDDTRPDQDIERPDEKPDGPVPLAIRRLGQVDDDRDKDDKERTRDDIDRRCLEADKVTDRCCRYFADDRPERCRGSGPDHLCRTIDVNTDRCCKYFADENPERCRDHCKDADDLTLRCCLYLAGDHPERCRDHEVEPNNYRKLFWRLVHAGEWTMVIRLLTHLGLV